MQTIEPRFIRRVAAFGLVGALLLGACSPGDLDNRGPTGSSTTAPPSTTTDDSSPSPASTGPITAPSSSTGQGSTPPTAAPTTEPVYPPPTHVDQNGFDDHSVPTLTKVEEWLGLSRVGVGGQRVVKFIVPDLAASTVHWMDSNFYALHDEWYWFRLLNGQTVEGSGVAPVVGPRFATIAEIYAWASARPPDDLPLDLQFTNGRGAERRLYSNRFYNLALNASPRKYAIGSVVRFRGVTDTPDRWFIELEFSDTPTPQALGAIFDRLRATLPDEIGRELGWVVRSSEQAELASRLVAEGNPLGALAIRFDELVAPGSAAVYSQGVAAGRLLYVGVGGAELARATDEDIIVMEHVPDYLPPARALLTSDLQTPLAHVNLLARNRRIPNASIAGIHNDPGLRQAARVRSLAAVVASGDGEVRVVVLTKEQYAQWQSRSVPPATSVEQPPPGDLPTIVDLTDAAASADTQAEVEAWRPIIGGKSAGFLSLLGLDTVTTPPKPMAITVVPYRAHIERLRGSIQAVLRDPQFQRSARARWLLLEGADDYLDVFPGNDDAAYLSEFTADRPPTTPVGRVLAAGGIRGMVRDQRMDPAVLDEITAALTDQYREYAYTAGLRFRSSSTVEDIEGFNGAGLYTSYTGYLTPTRLDDPDDRDNTVEAAILKTWASYWGFEAFEERRLEQIDHLSGGMGVTVHARFDDELERNNGVATYTFVSGGAADDAVVDINVQHGAIDVTNPDASLNAQPEVVRVTRTGTTVRVERVRGSTLDQGPEVISDAAAFELFAQLDAVAARWRDRLNASLPQQQRVQTVMLDFEFKTVDRGWPALAPGRKPFPARLVVRQVRSLEPGLRGLSPDVRALPIPRDVLSRAQLVLRATCDNSSATWLEVFTDPLRLPDLGHTIDPVVYGTSSTAPECQRTTLYANPDQLVRSFINAADAFTVVDTTG